METTGFKRENVEAALELIDIIHQQSAFLQVELGLSREDADARALRIITVCVYEAAGLIKFP